MRSVVSGSKPARGIRGRLRSVPFLLVGVFVVGTPGMAAEQAETLRGVLYESQERVLRFNVGTVAVLSDTFPQATVKSVMGVW